MSEVSDEILEVLRDFAESAADAALSMDNEGYQAAFSYAVSSGAKERDLKALLRMSGEEQEEVFGEEILPDDSRQAIADFQPSAQMRMSWG